MFGKFLKKIAEELGHAIGKLANKINEIIVDPKTQETIEKIARSGFEISKQIVKGVKRAHKEHLQDIAPSTVPWEEDLKKSRRTCC